MAEFCVAELGTVLGISTIAAKKLIGHALELRHRLPRLWAQVHAGRRPGLAGPAGRRGHHPLHPGVTMEAARSSTPVRCRRRQYRPRAARPPRRGVHHAVRPRRSRPGRRPGGRLPLRRPAPRHDPRPGRPLRRHLRLEAELDLADALDLDRALAQRAASLKALGSEESLDVVGPRRSVTWPGLRLRSTCSARATPAPRTGRLPTAREVVLHAHFDATTAGDRRSSVPRAGWRKASGFSCSTS